MDRRAWWSAAAAVRTALCRPVCPWFLVCASVSLSTSRPLSSCLSWVCGAPLECFAALKANATVYRMAILSPSLFETIFIVLSP